MKEEFLVITTLWTLIIFNIIFQDFYPINYLRNVALKFAETDNVFLSDIDFVPGTDAYPMLKKAASHLLTSQQ
jgi:hypothetical protein